MLTFAFLSILDVRKITQRTLIKSLFQFNSQSYSCLPGLNTPENQLIVFQNSHNVKTPFCIDLNQNNMVHLWLETNFAAFNF